MAVLVAVLVAAVALLSGCGSGSPVSPGAPSGGLRLPPVSSAAPTTTEGFGPVSLGTDWPTYHGDPSRAGYLPDGPDPRSPAVVWQTRLDGAVYASPLVVGAQVIAGTEGGSLYSLNAATGAIRWRTHLADPVPGSALPCGNIDPIGITGTPVYDPGTGQVFAVTTQAGISHALWAVDVTTGQIRGMRGVDAPGSLPATQLQRGALLLAADTVYVPYGGNFGDCGTYLGRVVGAPQAGLGPLITFAVPTTREAGIWAASGPVGLPGGDVLVSTGNGEARTGPWDHSDSLLRLSALLQLRDGFAPQGWAQENSVDADLGSTGPVLLPGDAQAIAAGKGGAIYLVNLDNLGGVGGARAQIGGVRILRRRRRRPGHRRRLRGLPTVRIRAAASPGPTRQPAHPRLAGPQPNHRLPDRGRHDRVVTTTRRRPDRPRRRHRDHPGHRASRRLHPIRHPSSQRNRPVRPDPNRHHRGYASPHKPPTARTPVNPPFTQTSGPNPWTAAEDSKVKPRTRVQKRAASRPPCSWRVRHLGWGLPRPC